MTFIILGLLLVLYFCGKFNKQSKTTKMKKTILLAIIAIFAFTNMNAQDEETSSAGLKGAWWGLGQFEYSDDEETSSYTILPAVGTFITPSITVGLGLGYTSTTVADADADGTFIVLPLVRKYWGVAEKLYIFAQADVPLTFNDNATGYGFNLSPGIDYFIGGHFTIEATFGKFGYNVVDPEEGDSTGTTSLGFNTFDIGFGLKYLF